MTPTPFKLIDRNAETPLTDPSLLNERIGLAIGGGNFQADARRFACDEPLEIALNTAIAVNEPLLITGEPGTGKTQIAYYAAYMLGIEPVIHFQVKSDSTARDLLYHFDAVRYFHDAHLKGKEGKEIDKGAYVEKRALWEAFDAGAPKVLLIDEIDKAPRDFPNDLLHELNQQEFKVLETDHKVSAKENSRPIVIITSNSERRLPEAFLRRCVYHHIPFSDDLVWLAVTKRQNEFQSLVDAGLLEVAVERFLALRKVALRKLPATGELLVWLRILGLHADQYTQALDGSLAELPHLGVLIKDHQDMEDIKKKRV